MKKLFRLSKIKLLYPNGEKFKEEPEENLYFAFEMHCVRGQLKKIDGIEFYDVNFS